MHIWQRFLKNSTALLQWYKKALFPETCIFCGEEGSFLCLSHQEIKIIPVPSTYHNKIAIHASAWYENKSIQTLITELKYKGNKQIAHYIAVYYEPFLKNEFTLVPVPLHWRKKLIRGFNQNERIIRSIEEYAPHMRSCFGLKRLRHTPSQTQYSVQERKINLSGSMVWDTSYPVPQKVLLIDDVYTTGSTAKSCIQALKKAGVQEIEVVVFAKSKGRNI